MWHITLDPIVRRFDGLWKFDDLFIQRKKERFYGS